MDRELHPALRNVAGRVGSFEAIQTREDDVMEVDEANWYRAMGEITMLRALLVGLIAERPDSDTWLANLSAGSHQAIERWLGGPTPDAEIEGVRAAVSDFVSVVQAVRATNKMRSE